MSTDDVVVVVGLIFLAKVTHRKSFSWKLRDTMFQICLLDPVSCIFFSPLGLIIEESMTTPLKLLRMLIYASFYIQYYSSNSAGKARYVEVGMLFSVLYCEY